VKTVILVQTSDSDVNAQERAAEWDRWGFEGELHIVGHDDVSSSPEWLVPSLFVLYAEEGTVLQFDTDVPSGKKPSVGVPKLSFILLSPCRQMMVNMPLVDDGDVFLLHTSFNSEEKPESVDDALPILLGDLPSVTPSKQRNTTGWAKLESADVRPPLFWATREGAKFTCESASLAMLRGKDLFPLMRRAARTNVAIFGAWPKLFVPQPAREVSLSLSFSLSRGAQRTMVSDVMFNMDTLREAFGDGFSFQFTQQALLGGASNKDGGWHKDLLLQLLVAHDRLPPKLEFIEWRPHSQVPAFDRERTAVLRSRNREPRRSSSPSDRFSDAGNAPIRGDAVSMVRCLSPLSWG